jgi:adenine-specific DNA-methyltransferase
MPTLTWVGKEKVVNHHHDVPFRLLDKQYTFRANESAPANSTGNRIIHGDNLEVLKSLLPEFEGKVNCIYIDPPYNTGNEGWVYNDNVNDPKIKKWLGQVVGKEGEDLSRHDKWLCMMYPRLKLLHRLLADDGAIFISIDDNEQAVFKLMMDEIFGGGNFIRNIIWHKRYAASNDSKGIPDVHDFIIVYGKSNLLKINLLPRTEKQDKLYKYDSNDGKGLWRPDNLSVKTYSSDYDFPIINKKTNKEYFPPNGRAWMSNEQQIAKWVLEKRIFFGASGDGAPQLKRYLNEVQAGVVPISYWSYDEVNHTDGAKKELKQIFAEAKVPFDTPKPTALIERVLQLTTDRTAIVLDSFAGSGTTAHAVLKLNAQDGGSRRFILCEMMDYAETITAERVRRVANGYGEGTKAVAGTGGGFDYYTVGAALFKADNNLNEDVGEAAIRDYVAYTENIPTALQCGPASAVSRYALGASDTALWIFYYERDQVTTLNIDFLASLNIKALLEKAGKRPEQFIIYADKCALDKDFLYKHGITFKRIPRDITRF